MKKFCDSLREHASNIIDFEKKKILPSTNNELNHIKMQKYDIFAEEKSFKSLLKINIIEKSEIVVTIEINIEAQYIVFAI